MSTLRRCLRDYRELWRVWVPLLVLSALFAPILFAIPLIEKQFIDGVLLAQQLDALLPTVGVYAGLWLLTTVGHLLHAALRTYLSERMMLRLRHRLFVHCATLSLAFSTREHSGRTMSLFVNDVPSLAGLFSSTVVTWFGSLVALVVGAVVMFGLNWQLAVVTGIIPPVTAGAAAVLTRPLRPAARHAQVKAAELNERLQENLAGLREVLAFGREQAQTLRFATTLRELVRLRMRVTLMDTAIDAGQSVFSLVVTLVLFGYGGYLVLHGQTTVGTLVAMRSMFSLLFQPAGQIFTLFASMQKSLGAADRVYAFLDERPEVRERPRALAPRRVVGRVAFERVSFAYQPGRPVLHDVSFVAEPGEVVALVGPSGAGKSTLVSLLARFYDPTSGHILLDGTDLRDLTLTGLRRHIGMVFQDTFLFAASVRENIAIGRPDASEADLIAAARAAHAWEFIQRLPHGLDTAVGERGTRLSEGQKQRLAIARALLRDPRILILDEPTAALDARSERLLQAALDNLLRGRTTFVIAHRLATIQRADRILVVDDGRIVERGSHAELLHRNGLYRELFDAQFGPATSDSRPVVAVAPLVGGLQPLRPSC
jgi:ABC-type multidrug transport system fused ATPase/permease subunit